MASTLRPLSPTTTPFLISSPFSSSPKPLIFPRRRKPLNTNLSIRDRGGEEPFTLSPQDCPVPFEQLPANEYKSLAGAAFFSWAADADTTAYVCRLLAVGAAFVALVGWPVAKFGNENDALRRGIGALSAGVLLDTLVVLRMYLGWAYVGNRLLSATVEYEETGWYDGQVWVKPPEVLARDRLLGTCVVKPVLNRVKLTLVLLAVTIVTCVLLFVNLGERKIASNIVSEEDGGRAVAGVYNDDSARSFEPDAFCGVSDLSHHYLEANVQSR